MKPSKPAGAITNLSRRSSGSTALVVCVPNIAPVTTPPFCLAYFCTAWASVFWWSSVRTLTLYLPAMPPCALTASKKTCMPVSTGWPSTATGPVSGPM